MSISTTGVPFDYLKELVGTSGPMIFDIGSFDGADSERLDQLFDDPIIHCFEPFPSAEHYRSSSVSIHHLALGDKNGVADWWKSDNHPQSSSLLEPDTHKLIWPKVSFSAGEQVTIRRLDDWMREHPEILWVDLMWVDVNGAEQEFLSGAMETLRNKVRVLHIEFSNKNLYKGQRSLSEIRAKLPFFEELGIYDYWGNYGNVLFQKVG